MSLPVVRAAQQQRGRRLSAAHAQGVHGVLHLGHVGSGGRMLSRYLLAYVEETWDKKKNGRIPT